MLWLADPMSIYCDWLVPCQYTVTGWSHVSMQIRPWDTLACCWDVKQPTNKQSHVSILWLADPMSVYCDGWPHVSILWLADPMSVYCDWLTLCQYTVTGWPHVSILWLADPMSIYCDCLTSQQYTVTGWPFVSILWLADPMSVYCYRPTPCQYTVTGWPHVSILWLAETAVCVSVWQCRRLLGLTGPQMYFWTLTLDVLYHTMPHTPCRFEVRCVLSLQCFLCLDAFWRKRTFAFHSASAVRTSMCFYIWMFKLEFIHFLFNCYMEGVWVWNIHYCQQEVNKLSNHRNRPHLSLFLPQCNHRNRPHLSLFLPQCNHRNRPHLSLFLPQCNHRNRPHLSLFLPQCNHRNRPHLSLFLPQSWIPLCLVCVCVCVCVLLHYVSIVFSYVTLLMWCFKSKC